jgi:exopolysaccharide production protein ExoQ
MSPQTALLVWLVLLLALLYFDSAKVPGTSVALWVPVIWLFILGSRLPSQWLADQVFGWSQAAKAQAMEDGNPLDRSILFGLILLSFVILILRSFRWGAFFARNPFLIAFLAYALISVLWSDSSFIAFKRWFRDLGNYFVVLIVLSDPCPLEAIRVVLRRLSYLLIPISIVLIKYFTELGMQYSLWTGERVYVGATTSKNMLGVMCLISGLFFFWDTVTRWSERKVWRTKRILLVNITLLGMTLWLLNLASSATSGVCLAIGCLVVLAAHSEWGRRHSTFIAVLMPVSFLMYLLLAFGLDLNGYMASRVGRDPTLTDRTLIWQGVLSMHTNPLVGTGYESFWLGSRLKTLWQMPSLGGINEAHNGFLELYLNLGFIGVALLVAFLISSYRSICKGLASSPKLASLNIAVWTIMLFYNMTEAAFKSQLMWIALLLAATAVPTRVNEQAQGATFQYADPRRSFPNTFIPSLTTRRSHERRGD